MKKIFTLVLGLMFTVAMFAADRRPSVTVTSARRYAIVIDGKQYFTNGGNTINISSLFNGRHDIKVYKMKRGFFMNTKRLVASSSFQLRNSYVKINVDRSGQLQISESRFRRDWNGHDFGTDSDRGHDHGYGRGDRDSRF